MEHSGIFTLIHTLASGLLLCHFKSLVFVFQLQFAMHESEHWSRNHAVISAHSIKYRHKFRIGKAESTAAACMFTFDLWHKHGDCSRRVVPFMGVAWSWLEA